MKRFSIVAALVVLFASSAASPTYAVTGDLDHTFGGYGNGGRIVGDPFPGTTLTATALQPDGKVVAVGSNGQDFVVARYDASGKLDPTFGRDGATIIDFAGKADFATAVALGPVNTFSVDTYIVVVGAATIAFRNDDFAVARLKPDGSPDTSFSQDGKVTVDFNSRNDRATAVVLDGFNIVVAGAAEENPPTGQCFPSCNDDFGLAYLNHDGSLNQNFGSNGKAESSFAGSATVDFGGDDVPQTLFLMPDDTIFVAGSSGSRLAMAHLTNTGEVVANSAATDDLGVAGAESVRAQVIALASSVQLWMIGSLEVGGSPRPVSLRRFLDGTADDGGRQIADFDYDDIARAAVFQPDGKLLVAGYGILNGQGGAALTRLTAVGALDPTFGGDGRLILASIPDGAVDIAVEPDGKILVAGRDFAVARLKPDGSLDKSFNGTGYAQVNITNGEAKSMLLQPDGKIVLAGIGSSVMILVRLDSAGKPDAGFGFDGIVRTGLGLGSEAFDVAIQSDDKLIAAGATAVTQSDANFALVR